MGNPPFGNKVFESIPVHVEPPDNKSPFLFLAHGGRPVHDHAQKTALQTGYKCVQAYHLEEEKLSTVLSFGIIADRDQHFSASPQSSKVLTWEERKTSYRPNCFRLLSLTISGVKALN